MKHLDKLRDDKLNKSPNICGGCYKEGFDDCQSEMMKVVKELREALEFYGSGRHIWEEAEYHPGNVSAPIGEYARQALAKLRELEVGE